MDINKENYEYWLVQLADGTLSPDERARVEVFLEANPEVKAEYELFLAAPKVEPLEECFEQKEELKKSVVVPLRPWRRLVSAAACVALLVGVGLRLSMVETGPAPSQQPPVRLVAGNRPAPPVDKPQYERVAPSKVGEAIELIENFETFDNLESLEPTESADAVETFTAPALHSDPAEYYALVAEMMLELAPLDEPEEEELAEPAIFPQPRMELRFENFAWNDFVLNLEHLWWSTTRTPINNALELIAMNN